MKKHLFTFVVICLLVFIGILFFNTDFESVDSLIRPPKIDGENHEIQAVFEAAVAKKYNLKSPLSGEYRTSFIKVDIDSDSEDEIVVFYAYTDAPDVVRMNILDELNGVWESVADLESNYNDVYQVSFADVDSDEAKEVVICWQNFETDITNKLSIYKVNRNTDNAIDCIFTKSYSEFLMCDVDSDTKTDVIIFEKSATANLSELKGSYYSFSEGDVQTKGEFTIDPAIASIGEVFFDRDDYTGSLRIYIDGYKTDSGMTTDIVQWNASEEHFQKLRLFDYESVSSLASRNINVNCRDFNGNKKINIPIEEYIQESSIVNLGETETSLQSIIKWVEINGEELNAVQYELINRKFGYSVLIDVEAFDKFTVVNDLEKGTLTFYELLLNEGPEKEKKPKKKENPGDDPGGNPQNEFRQMQIGEELFTILSASELDFGTSELSGYKLICSLNGYNYYCSITEKGKEKGITREVIESILII